MKFNTGDINQAFNISTNPKYHPLEHLKENEYQERLVIPYNNLISYTASQEYHLDLYGNRKPMNSPLLNKAQLRNSVLVDENSRSPHCTKELFVAQPERGCKSAYEDNCEARFQAIEQKLNNHGQYNKQIMRTLTKLESKLCSKEEERYEDEENVDWLLIQPHLEISRLEHSGFDSTSKKVNEEAKEPAIPDAIVKKQLKFQTNKENIVRESVNFSNSILKPEKLRIKHIDTANLNKNTKTKRNVKVKKSISRFHLNKDKLFYLMILLGFFITMTNLIYLL